jgi:hypothetical protein
LLAFQARRRKATPPRLRTRRRGGVVAISSELDRLGDGPPKACIARRSAYRRVRVKPRRTNTQKVWAGPGWWLGPLAFRLLEARVLRGEAAVSSGVLATPPKMRSRGEGVAGPGFQPPAPKLFPASIVANGATRPDGLWHAGAQATPERLRQRATSDALESARYAPRR